MGKYSTYSCTKKILQNYAKVFVGKGIVEPGFFNERDFRNQIRKLVKENYDVLNQNDWNTIKGRQTEYSNINIQLKKIEIENEGTTWSEVLDGTNSNPIELPDLDVELRDYQKKLVYKMIEQLTQIGGTMNTSCSGIGGTLNTSRMGLGKTVMAITSILYLKEKEDAKHVLLVAPASLLTQWEEEFEKFAAKRFTLIKNRSGGAKTRMKRLANWKKNGGVIMYSFSSFTTDRDEIIKSIKEIDTKSVLLIDEASYLKNRKSGRNKAARAISKIVNYKILLTATPIENCPEDLYHLCEIASKNVFGTKAFFTEFCITQYNRWSGFNEIVDFDSSALEELKFNYLSKIMCEANWEIVKEQLPQVQIHPIFLEMDRTEKRIYQDLVDWAGVDFSELVELVDSQIDEEEAQVKTPNILSLLIRTQQLLDDPALMLDSKFWQNYESELREKNSEAQTKKKVKRQFKLANRKKEPTKVAAWKDLIFRIAEGGQQNITITRFEKMARLLFEYAKEIKGVKAVLFTGKTSVKQKEIAKQKFKNGEYNLLIATSTIDYGHSFENCETMILYDVSYNAATNEQRMGRIQRVSGDSSVHRDVYIMHFKETIEQNIIEAVVRKNSYRTAIQEGLLSENAYDQITENY